MIQEVIQWIIDYKEVISAVGVIIAAIGLYFNWRRTSMAVKENKEKKNEKKKAYLRIERSHAPSRSKRGYKDVLIIENTGESDAKNIQFYINGKTANEHGLFFMSEVPDRITSKNSITINLMIHKQTAPPWKIKIVYDDDFEDGREFETIVN
ncbi:hypothetical protein ACTWQB_15660 [Piscibacillus sp. B03]|uniref:hypothetical protein n=1 Tax=Piscibacillus sp. B03 TaxID=3457430 RepID=UPI003FCE1858